VSMTLREEVRGALIDYKNGSLKYEQLPDLCATRIPKVPIVDPENPEVLKETDPIYMDSAASAPLLLPPKLFAETLEAKYRSNYGRSYGYSEKIIRRSLHQTRAEALAYFGGVPQDHIVVLGSNTTNLILIFYQHVLARDSDPHIFISRLSHSAASMPLRKLPRETWEYIPLSSCFSLDLDGLEKRLKELRRNGSKEITLVGETTSNVTGYETEWREMISLAERYGCRVLLDNAQGGPFIEIRLKDYSADVFVVISGHKMGARDGSGVLVGPYSLFEREVPLQPTAGMILHYTEDREYFLLPPLAQEYGTPNYIAQASLAESFKVFSTVGLSRMKEGLRKRTLQLLGHLEGTDRVKVLGCAKHSHPRYGSISFVVHGEDGREVSSPAVAAALAYFHGVQLRSNHLCAPVYIQALKGIDNERANQIAESSFRLALGQDVEANFQELQRLDVADIDICSLWVVRPSVGFGTTEAVVDRFGSALRQVIQKKEYTRLTQTSMGATPQALRGGSSFTLEHVPSGLPPHLISRLVEPEVPEFEI